MLGQRKNASEEHEYAAAESIHETQDELLREQARKEDLNNQPRLIRMDPPKLDATAPHTIDHWLVAVEQCGVAQLIGVRHQDGVVCHSAYAWQSVRVILFCANG